MTQATDFIRHITHYSAAALAALFFCGAVAAADTVTVTAAGGLAMTGEMVGFDGTYLRLGTEHSVLTLDYSLVSCVGAACPDADAFVPELRLVGAPRLGALVVPALIEAYALAQGGTFQRVERVDGVAYSMVDADGGPILHFDLRLTSTETGFAALLANEGDVLMATRELSGAEIDIAEEAGLGTLKADGQMRMLALDALVPVVSPGQAVRSISLDTLSRLFAGEITDWAALGGADIPVTLHLAAEGDGQTQAFIRRFLLAVERTLAAEVIWHSGPDAVLDAVVTDPGAIGLVPMRETGFTHPLAIVESCGARPIAASDAVQSEDYPLTFPAYLYLPERRMPPAATDFLQWLTSVQAQLVLRRAGILGQSPTAIPTAQDGERLAGAIRAAGPEVSLADLQQMLSALDGLERQTLTFRFEDGAATLDPASRSHARFLAQAIADGTYDGRRLVFVGFSDGAGPAIDNVALSQERAVAVNDAIRTRLGGTWSEGTTPEIMAFGEALPIGCDDTIWGRGANRRVEFWLEARP